MALKFYTSVTKGLKLKVRKFSGLISTFVGGPFPDLNRIKENREIDLQLLASFLIAFLNEGFIFAILHFKGKLSRFVDRFIMLAKWIAITGAPSLRNGEDMYYSRSFSHI